MCVYRYIDTRLRDAYARRIKKKKRMPDRKRIRTWEGREKVRELAQNSTEPLLVKKNVCSKIIVATLSKPKFAFLRARP